MPHPRLDPADLRTQPLSLGVLHAILRPGRVGRDPHPPQRTLPAGLPFLVPGHHVPARQHDILPLGPNRQRHRGIPLRYPCREWGPRRGLWADDGDCHGHHRARDRGHGGLGPGEEGQSV